MGTHVMDNTETDEQTSPENKAALLSVVAGVRLTVFNSSVQTKVCAATLEKEEKEEEVEMRMEGMHYQKRVRATRQLRDAYRRYL